MYIFYFLSKKGKLTYTVIYVPCTYSAELILHLFTIPNQYFDQIFLYKHY